MKIRTEELAAKIQSGAPLTDKERQAAAMIVKFAGLMRTGAEQLDTFGAGTAVLTAPSEESEHAAPLFAVIVLDEPDEKRWAALQAALAALTDDEPVSAPVPGLWALIDDWKAAGERAQGQYGLGLSRAANDLRRVLSDVAVTQVERAVIRRLVDGWDAGLWGPEGQDAADRISELLDTLRAALGEGP